jgi:hypothetical protein
MLIKKNLSIIEWFQQNAAPVALSRRAAWRSSIARRYQQPSTSSNSDLFQSAAY